MAVEALNYTYPIIKPSLVTISNLQPRELYKCAACGSDRIVEVMYSGQNREASAERGEMEKRANLNTRDSHPLRFILQSHVHVCCTGLPAHGRSILNLFENVPIIKSTNFI